MSGAVTARLTVVDEHPFFGHAAWHLQAQVHTNSPLRYLYAVDDQFDSYSARADLVGLQFEMYMHQSSKSENLVQRLSSTQSPAPAGVTQVQVLPGTRDALGFLYYLRNVNWQQMAEVRSPVFDGHKLYEVRARVATQRDEISVLAGKYTVTGIAIRIYNKGVEMDDAKMTLWLAQDAAHTPVLIEVDLPFGSGRVELTQPVFPN